MTVRQGNLSVTEETINLNIDNQQVRVRLYLRDGGYVQEFYALDQNGHWQLLLSSLQKNLITASEHRMCSSPMIAGEKQHLFGICRDSLRMAYSEAKVVQHDENRVVVELSGKLHGHSLKCRMTLEHGADNVHVCVEDQIERNGGDPLVEYLMSSFAFLPAANAVVNNTPLDYVWAPAMRPASDQIIGDCAFHSPAVIVQHGPRSAAMVPDLNILSTDRPMPSCLDLDLNNGLLAAPLLSYGFCGYQPTSDGNSCFHDMTMAKRLDPPKLRYAYHLLLSATSKRATAHRRVAEFLWDNYGTSALSENCIQSKPISSPKWPLQTVLPFGDINAEKSQANDFHTSMRPLIGRDILRKAVKYLDTFKKTANRTQLDHALKLTDQLCLLQSVWQKPWEKEPHPVGLCVSGNTGWQPDVLFSAEFGLHSLRCGSAVGQRQYFERGALALRAALSCSHSDQETHKAVTSVTNEAVAKYGAAFVHVSGKWVADVLGIGLSGASFDRGRINLKLKNSGNGNGDSRIVFAGMRGKTYKVCFNNNCCSYASEELRAGIAATCKGI